MEPTSPSSLSAQELYHQHLVESKCKSHTAMCQFTVRLTTIFSVSLLFSLRFYHNVTLAAVLRVLRQTSNKLSARAPLSVDESLALATESKYS